MKTQSLWTCVGGKQLGWKVKRILLTRWVSLSGPSPLMGEEGRIVNVGAVGVAPTPAGDSACLVDIMPGDAHRVGQGWHRISRGPLHRPVVLQSRPRPAARSSLTLVTLCRRPSTWSPQSDWNRPGPLSRDWADSLHRFPGQKSRNSSAKPSRNESGWPTAASRMAKMVLENAQPAITL